MRERRRSERVILTKPVQASIDSLPVFILDVSRGGLRVLHSSQLPKAGAVCRLNLPTETGPISLDCAVVHTTIQHATAAAQRLFNTGLQIVSADEQSVKKFTSAVIPKRKIPEKL